MTQAQDNISSAKLRLAIFTNKKEKKIKNPVLQMSHDEIYVPLNRLSIFFCLQWFLPFGFLFRPIWYSKTKIEHNSLSLRKLPHLD